MIDRKLIREAFEKKIFNEKYYGEYEGDSGWVRITFRYSEGFICMAVVDGTERHYSYDRDIDKPYDDNFLHHTSSGMVDDE